MSSTYAHRHINFMAMRENFAMIWKTFHHFYKFFATAAHEFCINEKKNIYKSWWCCAVSEGKIWMSK